MRRDRYRYSQLAIAQLVERRTVDVNYDAAILRSMVRIRLARASILCFNLISDDNNNIVMAILEVCRKIAAFNASKTGRDSNEDRPRF